MQLVCEERAYPGNNSVVLLTIEKARVRGVAVCVVMLLLLEAAFTEDALSPLRRRALRENVVKCRACHAENDRVFDREKSEEEADDVVGKEGH